MIASISKHDVFIDAFYGSDSIILNQPKTIRNIAIDLNDKYFTDNLDIEFHSLYNLL